MRYQLLSFDLDGTLAEAGKGISRETADQLLQLERKGYRILLNSGKNTAYLSGIARAIGLENPLLIGENGCIILDPNRFHETVMVERSEAIPMICEEVLKDYDGKVWVQPNQVALTFFPKERAQVPQLAAYIRELIKPYQDKLHLYEHIDAVDIAPMGMDKGKALSALIKQLGLRKEEVIAVGDSHNDLPMFKEAGLALVIGRHLKVPEAKTFDAINQALYYIEALE